jgi:RNA polymerase sigma-70 factor (ECF subfamily)
MDKTELIKQCQLGDIESFSKLYNLYSKKALGTAYLIAGSSGLAEDIVHEAFIHCFNYIHTLKSAEAFDTWFFKIVTRTGWRIVKSNKTNIGIEEISGETPIVDPYAAEELASCENRLMMHDALSKLSMPLRTVIVLHYFNDLSVKDISEVLGCFEGTVKSRLHNAKKQLKKIFHEDEFVSVLNSNYTIKECKVNEI